MRQPPSRAVVSGVVNETLAGVWLRACPWSTGLLLPRTVSRARSQGRVGCLVSRRDRPAGESWAASPPTDRQAVNVGTITRHFGIRLPRLQGPLQRPTTGSLTPTRADSASWRTSHPRKSSPRSQPRSSCGPRPARAGRSGDAARRPASDPGRLKAPHARPRLSRRASGAAGSLRGRARGGSRRSTVARGRTRTRARPSPRPTASSPSSSRTR